MRHSSRRACSALFSAVTAASMSLMLAGCRHSEEPKATSATSASTQIALSAPGAALESSTAPLLDLLHRVAVLLVTSSHKNALSLGEFLVDEQASSAWRPNPPDPEPWFELQFAHDVDVHSVSVEVAPSGAGATLPRLLLASPELGAATEHAGRYSFEPNRPVRARSIRITIDDPERAPGRNRAERIALSELKVQGASEPQWLLSHALPEARVAHAEPRPSVDTQAIREWWRGAPYRDLDAVCAKYEALLKVMAVDKQSPPSDSDIINCSEHDAVRPSGKAPPLIRGVSEAWITLKPTGDMGDHGAGFLLVRSDAGWLVANLWSTTDSFDGTCPGMEVGQVKITRSFWEGSVIVQERSRVFYPATGTYGDDDTRPSAAARSLLRCDTSKAPMSCREYVVAYGSPDVMHDESYSQTWPVVPKVWQWERSLSVAENGWLRFSPCSGAALEPSDKTTPRANAFGAQDSAAKGAERGTTSMPCFTPQLYLLP